MLESSALETYLSLVSWKRGLQVALIPQLILPLLFTEQRTVFTGKKPHVFVIMCTLEKAQVRAGLYTVSLGYK